MMQGYYKDPAKTKEALPDGKFLRTGDVAKIDESGNVYIIDRLKDMICTEMAQNVAPVDIEKVLVKHPAVGEASVLGIMHPSHAGDMIVAWIVTKKDASLTPAEIKDFVESSGGLAPWQLPACYEITDKPLPKPAGKVLKRVLRSPEFVRENLGEHILRIAASKQSGQSPAEAVASPTPSWQAHAETVFDLIDVEDKTGTLGVDKLGRVVAEKHAEAVMQALDVDRDGGEVTRAKFLSFISHPEDVTRKQLLLT